MTQFVRNGHGGFLGRDIGEVSRTVYGVERQRAKSAASDMSRPAQNRDEQPKDNERCTRKLECGRLFFEDHGREAKPEHRNEKEEGGDLTCRVTNQQPAPNSIGCDCGEHG